MSHRPTISLSRRRPWSFEVSWVVLILNTTAEKITMQNYPEHTYLRIRHLFLSVILLVLRKINLDFFRYFFHVLFWVRNRWGVGGRWSHPRHCVLPHRIISTTVLRRISAPPTVLPAPLSILPVFIHLSPCPWLRSFTATCTLSECTSPVSLRAALSLW